MHHSILIPPGVRGRLKSRMKTCWSDQYALRRYVCSSIDEFLQDLNEARFGLTTEAAKCYFVTNGNTPLDSDMNAACEELIKKYPNSLEKMFNDGMRKKLGMVCTMLLGQLRASDDRMCHHDILKELLAIRWENPNDMTHADQAIKALQIRLNYKINDMDNFLRDDSDYDGLVVVYPSAVEDRLESLCSMTQNIQPDRFKGIIAELDIISKCVIPPWRKSEKLKIRDYHEIASKWMTKIDMDEGYVSRSLDSEDAKKNDIDPSIVIMSDMLHEAIANYSCIPDFLIMPGVQSLLRWFILERYILHIRLQPPEEEEPDSECDCPVAAEPVTEI